MKTDIPKFSLNCISSAVFLLLLSLILMLFYPAAKAVMIRPLAGQVLQVNTHFNCILGQPSWLLILRDTETGITLPYIFDMSRPNDYFVAFSATRNTEVAVSQIKFGKFAVLHNFCHLENCLLTNQSLFITLTGNLSPNPRSFNCEVIKYLDTRPLRKIV